MQQTNYRLPDEVSAWARACVLPSRSSWCSSGERQRRLIGNGIGGCSLRPACARSRRRWVRRYSPRRTAENRTADATVAERGRRRWLRRRPHRITSYRRRNGAATETLAATVVVEESPVTALTTTRTSEVVVMDWLMTECYGLALTFL